MAKKKSNKNHDATGIDDEIREFFNADEPAEGEEEENLFQLPAIREKAELPVETETKDTTEDEKIERDSEYARNNLYELIEHGMAAVQDITHLAREQMHPRTYEVLSDLIANMAKNNIALLELANQKKAVKKKDGQNGDIQPTSTVNNIEKAVFVGSSHELLKALKENDNSKK